MSVAYYILCIRHLIVHAQLQSYMYNRAGANAKGTRLKSPIGVHIFAKRTFPIKILGTALREEAKYMECTIVYILYTVQDQELVVIQILDIWLYTNRFIKCT